MLVRICVLKFMFIVLPQVPGADATLLVLHSFAVYSVTTDVLWLVWLVMVLCLGRPSRVLIGAPIPLHYPLSRSIRFLAHTCKGSCSLVYMGLQLMTPDGTPRKCLVHRIYADADPFVQPGVDSCSFPVELSGLGSAPCRESTFVSRPSLLTYSQGYH